MKARRYLAAMIICLAPILISVGQVQAAEPAREQLRISIDRILDVLRNPELKSEDRREERRGMLRQIANERFDYVRMSQLSLGKHWRDRSDDEKETFISLFSTLLENTYMSKIEAYTDEKVVYVGERVKKRKAQVNTKIITDSVEIPINYRMYEKQAGTWMVYDMVIEGVSLVANYRSQFSQILEKDTFDALVKKLKEKKD